jgi:hypothetical protein
MSTGQSPEMIRNKSLGNPRWAFLKSRMLRCFEAYLPVLRANIKNMATL